jgi:lysozyme
MNSINQATLSLIESFEGLRLNAYLDSVGVPTIGYGHTRGVKIGQVITESQAQEFLKRDLQDAIAGVERLVTTELTDNQFGALVSLVFNIGIGNFAKSSLLRKVNMKQFIAAADSFAAWNKAGGKVLPGLTRRRAAEKKLFLT